MKKNIKKTNKYVPEYTVDITNVTSEFDVVLAFAVAKLSAGVALNGIETNAILIVAKTNAVLDIMSALFGNGNAVILTQNGFVSGNAYVADSNEMQTVPVTVTKKPNIFKRFWNWITRK